MALPEWVKKNPILLQYLECYKLRRKYKMSEIKSLQPKPDYTQYVDYLEERGWTREQLTLDELNTNLVTLYSVAANATGVAIDVRAPAGQKISIMGTQQIPRGADARSAHAFRMRLSDTSDNEIALNTKIRISKEKTSEALVQLARIFYADINLTKNAGGAGNIAVTYKTDLEWFRFKQGVELNGEQHMRVYVVNTLGSTQFGGGFPALIGVDAAHTRFALDMDLGFGVIENMVPVRLNGQGKNSIFAAFPVAA